MATDDTAERYGLYDLVDLLRGGAYQVMYPDDQDAQIEHEVMRDARWAQGVTALIELVNDLVASPGIQKSRIASLRNENEQLRLQIESYKKKEVPSYIQALADAPDDILELAVWSLTDGERQRLRERLDPRP
jgi:hypothetical protein